MCSGWPRGGCISDPKSTHSEKRPGHPGENGRAKPEMDIRLPPLAGGKPCLDDGLTGKLRPKVLTATRVRRVRRSQEAQAGAKLLQEQAHAAMLDAEAERDEALAGAKEAAQIAEDASTARESAEAAQAAAELSRDKSRNEAEEAQTATELAREAERVAIAAQQTALRVQEETLSLKDEAEAKLANARRVADELEQTLSRTHERLNTAQSRLDDTDNARLSALQELQTAIQEKTTLAEQVAGHTGALDNAKQRSTDLERGMRGLQAEKQALQSRLAEQEDAINATRIQWNRERTAFEQLVEEGQEKAASTERSLAASSQKVAALEADADALQEASKQARERHVRLKAERDKARFELDELRGQFDEASKETAVLGEQRDKALDQMSLFKGEREAAVKDREIANQARDQALENLKEVSDKQLTASEEDKELKRRIHRLESERQDMSDARREADRRRQEAEDAMRSAQDRSVQEVQMLLTRIQQVETELATTQAAAAKARLEAEPRIAAWKAMASEADEIEFEDED